MDDQIDGQLDLLDLIDDPPAKTRPPFTVYVGPNAIAVSNTCGYCGGKGYWGGGCGPARGDKPSYAYQYCKNCVEAHGSPRPWAPNWKLVQT